MLSEQIKGRGVFGIVFSYAESGRKEVSTTWTGKQKPKEHYAIGETFHQALVQFDPTCNEEELQLASVLEEIGNFYYCLVSNNHSLHPATWRKKENRKWEIELSKAKGDQYYGSGDTLTQAWQEVAAQCA